MPSSRCVPCISRSMALPMSCRNAARTVDVRVEADFLRHDAGEARDFGRVRQHVLSVARAELQAAHQPAGSPDADRAGRARTRPPRPPCASPRRFRPSPSGRLPRCAPGECGRPRSAARSPACATSRRYGSKPDRMIAPGVSSTMRSTPVASSSARMLRPSRPMMRPLRSSLGRSTTDTVVSTACSPAQRWMACGDVVLGAIDGRLARFGVEALEQVGRVVPRVGLDLLDQQFLRFVGGQARDALELVLLARDQLARTSSRPPRRCFSRSETARSRAARSLSVRSIAGLALGEGGLAPVERLLERVGLLALLARLLLGVAQQLVRLLLGFEERLLSCASRRRARRLSAGGAACSSARPTVSAAMALAVRPATRHTRPRRRATVMTTFAT